MDPALADTSLSPSATTLSLFTTLKKAMMPERPGVFWESHSRVTELEIRSLEPLRAAFHTQSLNNPWKRGGLHSRGAGASDRDREERQ